MKYDNRITNIGFRKETGVVKPYKTEKWLGSIVMLDINLTIRYGGSL